MNEEDLMKRKELIKREVFTNDIGLEILLMPSSRLDFSASFVFLGFTKTGNVKLGDVNSAGPNREDWKWRNCYGLVEETDDQIIIRTQQSSYVKRIKKEEPQDEVTIIYTYVRNEGEEFDDEENFVGFKTRKTIQEKKVPFDSVRDVINSIHEVAADFGDGVTNAKVLCVFYSKTREAIPLPMFQCEDD